jgi:hypothetical protein
VVLHELPPIRKCGMMLLLLLLLLLVLRTCRLVVGDRGGH